MSTSAPRGQILSLVRPRILLLLAAAGVLASLLGVLARAVRNDPLNSTDVAVMERIVDWDFPGLNAFMEVISFLTDNYPRMALGMAGVLVLAFLGLHREAAAVGAIVAVTAFIGDVTLGEVVALSRPLDDASRSSFPSGHVFGSTVIFGFWAYLGIYYRLTIKLLIPLLAAVTVLTDISHIKLPGSRQLDMGNVG